MSLRLRLLFALSAIVGAYAVAQLAIQTWVVAPKFQELEDAQALEDLDRVLGALQSEAQHLDGLCHDWAAWDDTYRYVAEPYAEYEQGTLQDTTLENNRLAVVYATDTEGRVRIRRFHGLPDDLSAFPAEADPALAGILRVTRPQEARSGVLLTEAGPLLLAVRPILPSDELGLVRGSLVMARRLDAAVLRELSRQTRVLFRVQPFGEALLSSGADGGAARRLARHEPMPVQQVDDTWTGAWGVMDDLRGEPALLVRVQVPREISSKGAASVSFAFCATLGVSALILCALLMLLRKTVVGPLTRLRRHAVAIRRDGDLSRRLEMRGRDEISELAREFDRMVERVAAQVEELEGKNRELVEARERAAAASRAKSEFLTNMSHEIRTPMTAILGYAELLSDPALPREQVAEHVAVVRRNGEHLLSILNDLLDLSKIEAGALRVETLSFSLREVLDEVRTLLLPRAEQKGLRFEVAVEVGVPDWIESDPLRLRQILLNLAGNAVKFTSSGGVEVRVRRRAALADGSLILEFEVADSGIGLSQTQCARLFQPFSQADSSTTRRFGGTGLGLSICRRLAELLGGSIAVTSAPGAGSTFVCDIRARPAAPRPGSPVSRPIAPAAAPGAEVLRGVRVLLAEDGKDNQRLLALILRRAGAAVEVAGNGEEAIEAIRASEARGAGFEVVLMDMQMPVLDGYGATAELRQRGWSGPVVALTAHAMAGDRERCVDVGCDDYLTKPVDREQLIAVCARLARRGLDAQKPSATPAPTHTGSPSSTASR
jgi:signal transduction histidine kinase/ActR/RegA family two-component response regulator